jgi:hypothetical protein
MKNIFFSLMIFILFFNTGCKEKNENKLEEGMKNISNNVNHELKKIDKVAGEKTKEFSDKIDQGAKVLSNKASDVLKKVDKKNEETKKQN